MKSVLVEIALLVGGLGVCFACAATPASQPASTAPAQGGTVTIDNFTFSPAELTVSAGTTVTWTNKDDVPHTVTSTGKPRTLDSGALDTDGTFSYTFKARGTYPYFCAVHPKMTGTINVK